MTHLALRRVLVQSLAARAEEDRRFLVEGDGRGFDIFVQCFLHDRENRYNTLFLALAHHAQFAVARAVFVVELQGFINPQSRAVQKDKQGAVA